MYLKPDEKGTPFGRSLLVQAIIASTPPPPFQGKSRTPLATV